MLMCEQIAIGNTINAVDLCNRYGYSVDETSPTHIAETLNGIIEENPNKQTLKEVCNIHPDKDLILELFQPENKKIKLNACGSCKQNSMITDYNRIPLFSATGNSNSTTDSNGTFKNMISMQTNTILILGVVIIGVAILYKQKN